MRNGINSEKTTHELMPEWAFAIPDAENTVRIMKEAPCLIAVLNTNQHTPFASIENEKRIVEICDSLSIGAAIENMILTATGYGLGTLWIANTCFAYNELMKFIGTDIQLTGIVAVGFADGAREALYIISSISFLSSSSGLYFLILLLFSISRIIESSLNCLYPLINNWFIISKSSFSVNFHAFRYFQAAIRKLFPKLKCHYR